MFFRFRRGTAHHRCCTLSGLVGGFSFFLAAVSMLCGVLVFFLFRSYVFPNIEKTDFGSFAVLVLDESQNDRRIREILGRGGMEGFISESSQEVPVDDFGSLKMVPLDIYRDEIDLVDPRDTGYAEKLRTFFVRDGMRFFFLPLGTIAGSNTAKLNKQLTALLQDIPFTFTVLGQRSSPFFNFVLLAAACVFALYFSSNKRLFVFGLPVILAFAWSGSSAFVLTALLVGIWELLREPIRELSAARRYERPLDYAGAGFQGLLERLKPFRLNCFLALLFLVFLVVFSAAAGLFFFPLAAAFLCFFLLYSLALRAESERVRKSRHVPFIPVPLFPFKARTFSLFPLLLPFVFASLLALFLPFFLPGFSPFQEKESPVDTHYLINPEDYYRYIDFQISFSYRPFDQDFYPDTTRPAPAQRALNQKEYLSYYLDEDGLIAGSTGFAIGHSIEDPPFPLEKLMDFLLNYDKVPDRGFEVSGLSLFTFKEWISVAIILAVCTLDLLPPAIRPGIQPWLQNKKKKKVPVFTDKRSAAWKANSLTRSERRFPS